MELQLVAIDKPDDTNVILGQTHFIKSVEDIHEALVGAGPHLVRAGLLRSVGQVPGALVRHRRPPRRAGRRERARPSRPGTRFIVFLGDGYPVNVLNTLKMVPEVCRIFCATANPVEIVVAETEHGRGITGRDRRAGAGWRRDRHRRGGPQGAPAGDRLQALTRPQLVGAAALADELGRRGVEVVVYTRRDDPDAKRRICLSPGVVMERIGLAGYT